MLRHRFGIKPPHRLVDLAHGKNIMQMRAGSEFNSYLGVSSGCLWQTSFYFLIAEDRPYFRMGREKRR